MISARAIGCRVPAGDFDFRVHGVFASALNLAPTGHPSLVTLVGEGADDAPHAIRLATRERFDDWGVAPGTPGRRQGDSLVLETTGGCGARVVELAGAEVGGCEPLPRVRAGSLRSRAAWAECAERLAELQSEKDTELRLAGVCGRLAPACAIGRRFAGVAPALADAVRTHDAHLADAAAARILGLGSGLTPSGDDFLCGLLAALGCTSTGDGPDRHFVRAWGTALAARLDATNAISATFLRSAIAGCFPGALRSLAAAFGEPREGRMAPDPRGALERVCASGHSSGMDTATGFLFGLWLRTGDESRRYAS
jgi:hypothetical protein